MMLENNVSNQEQGSKVVSVLHPQSKHDKFKSVFYNNNRCGLEFLEYLKGQHYKVLKH